MKSEFRTVTSLALLYAIRMFGLFMVLPVMFIYGANHDGATPATLGFALGVYGLTQAVFQIPLGLLSDFIGRKPVIVAGLLIFALGSLIAASADSVYGLILGRALQGSGAIASTVMALVSDLTSEENRTKAMAAIGASIGLSFTVALIAGPALASVAGLSGIFFVAFILGLIGVLIAVFWVPTPKRSGKSHRDSGAIPSLLAHTFVKPELVRLNVGIFTLHAVLTAMFVAVPSLLVSHAGIQEQSHWLVYLPVMLLSFITAVPLMIVAEKKRRGKEAFVSAVCVLAITFFALAQVPKASGLIVLLFLFFAAFNLLEAMLPSLVSKLAPAGSKGTAMGIYSTWQFSGAFIGGAVGGLVVSHYGVAALFYICACASIFWFLVALFMSRPKPLSSLCFPVSESVIALDLVDNNGIEDAIYVPEDGLLYLKVDKQRLDVEALKVLLEPYTL